MTLEEKVILMIKRDVAEYNDVSRHYEIYKRDGNIKSEINYRGRLTAMSNKLLDYAWELGYNITFGKRSDLENNVSYEIAIFNAE